MEVKLQFWQQWTMAIFNLIVFMFQLATFFNEKNILTGSVETKPLLNLEVVNSVYFSFSNFRYEI